MRKVLIIGPKFHYFLDSVRRAFVACGCEVAVVSYENPVHPYDTCNKILYKLCCDKSVMKERSRERFRPYIEQQFLLHKPDCVFILNGDNLLPDTVRLFAASARVGIWLFDSLSRVPDCGRNLPYAHEVFCYEREDLAYISSTYGVKAHFLPQAVDEELYFPSPVPPKWDIVFAGDMVHSARRREIMRAVVAHYPHLRIRVWGIYKLWFKNPWKWLTRERRDVYTNCNTTARQLNADYNASRIVLNIHHEQQRDGANPKVYEIAASGAYQICDANPYISQLFPHGEVGFYSNIHELFEQIDRALSSDMSSHAEEAHKIIMECHTFRHRMEEVLKVLFPARVTVFRR